MPPKAKYLASTSLIDAEPYLEPFAQTGDIEGMGTVTSVAVSVPAYMAVAGSPVTTSGTITLDFDDVDDNKFFGGSAGVTAGTPPTFRYLVTADIPNNIITLAKLATQAANTILANATSSAAVPTAFPLAVNQFLAMSSEDATIQAKAISDDALAFVAAANDAAMRTELGLGTMAVENVASLPTVTFADEANIVVDTTTGTKIGTSDDQRLGFYGASPVEQPNSTGTLIGFDPGVGDPVLQDSTFTGNSGSAGYTIGDIVRHLKALGLLRT